MKHFFLFLVLMLSFTSNAQINYEKGYFITNANEKVVCFIKNADWRNNPTSFEYKINVDDSKPTTANILNVSEFVIEGESKYKRFEVNIEKSENIVSNLSQSKYPVWQKETLFLKALIEGDASLYYYVDATIFKFFYTTKTLPVEQLVCIKYKATEDDGIKTNSMYRQQLYNNVRTDAMPTDGFKTIEYETSGLIRHFTQYNSSLGATTNSYVAKSPKGQFKIKITAGIGSGKLAIYDPGTSLADYTTDVSKTFYQFGTELEYILPFNKNKWAIFIDPTYQKFDTEKRYTKSDGLIPPHDIEHIAKVKYTSIALPVGVRYYMFLNNNSKIFVNAMYSVNFSTGSEINLDEGNYIFKIKPKTNMVFGIGYTYKDRYGVELRRNFPRELLGEQVQWSARYTTLELQFSYKIL